MAREVEALYDHWEPLDQEKFTELMLDFELFCSKGSLIIDKNGLAVPFELNEAQLEVAGFILAEVFKEVPQPINLFIHKSRQMGISVVIAKIEQYLATRLRNRNMVHIMPTEDDADDLFENKFIPQVQATHPQLMPVTHKTTRRLRFKQMVDVPLKNTVSFMSAEKRSGGRGQTNQIVIEDEQAYYVGVASLERGILATMPKVGMALRVVVSTANGMNHFSDLAKIAKKSTHWKYLFLPWHMLKEYELEPTGRLKSLESLTKYELKLCDIFEKAGYPIETWTRKMQWYEYTFQTEAGLDEDFMFENYPSTPEESFAATGKPVLPQSKIVELRDKEVKFEYIEVVEDENGKVDFLSTNLSTIKRFKRVQPYHRYIIAADPADGDENNDASAAVVIDLTTMEAVCCVKDKLDQNDFAELLVHLAIYYNKAQIIPERNTGEPMIMWMTQVLKYPRVYIDPKHTTRSRVSYGIYMTRPVKNEAIMRLKFLLNFYKYRDYDPDWIEEALHFVWLKTPSGIAKAAADSGYHDDTVMARLIAVMAMDMKQFKEYINYRNNQNGQEDE